MLLDTNVLVAAVVPHHPHHESSGELVLAARAASIAMHTLLEFANTMTHQRRYAWSSEAVNYQLAQFEARFDVLTIRPQQVMNVLTTFISAGHRGPLIYDFFIGQHAALHSIGTIVTWNEHHMRPLFPELRVVTPVDFLKAA